MVSEQYLRRLDDVRRLYDFLEYYRVSGSGLDSLSNLDRKPAVSRGGVYFFFEPGEERSTSGLGYRVVRVGTHGLNAGSISTLRGRLRAHRGQESGTRPGGGNHRGSVFRKHVGRALISRGSYPESAVAQWGRDPSDLPSVRDREYPLEGDVSAYVGRMPLVWIEIDDAPGPNSLRGYVERNNIALLSNFATPHTSIDPPSSDWLGNVAASTKIRQSGLWNVDHVDASYQPELLDVLRRLVERSRHP